LRYAAIVLALISLACGLVAARSKVKIDPAWELEIRGDVGRNIMGWVTGVMLAFTKASSLNQLAALWTAASVVLSARATRCRRPSWLISTARAR
jgi:hypothetical protein